MTLEKNRKGLTLKGIFEFLYFSQCNYEIALGVKKKFLSAKSVFGFSNFSFFCNCHMGSRVSSPCNMFIQCNY